MINDSQVLWSKQQLSIQLASLTHLFRSKTFTPSTPFTHQSQLRWLELIRAVSDLVRQSLWAGRRIEFTEEVSALGPSQDITSLLETMRKRAYLVAGSATFAERTVLLNPALNHCYGRAVGYFPNGLFFCCPHARELAFFIGQDRIYFYRHLMRAFIEARGYLQSLP